jgi:hypothetical protein
MEAFFAAFGASSVPPPPMVIDTDSAMMRRVSAVKNGDNKSSR